MYDGSASAYDRMMNAEIEGWARAAGFTVDRCTVEPVDDMQMDAVYLEAARGAA